MNAQHSLPLVCIISFLAFSARAADWHWQEDPSFYNPRVQPDLAEHTDGLQTTCMVDLSGDGKPEYLMLHGTWDAMNLALAEHTGQFPEITWQLREAFFNGIDIRFNHCAIVPYDLSGNGEPELIFVPWNMHETYLILENRGDYDNPNWQRADHLFPDVDYESERCTPQFCDLDDNGLLDIVLGYDNGYIHFEQDESGDWDLIGYTEVWEDRWTSTFFLSDLDGDGDLDILGSYDMPCRWRTTSVTLNEGRPDEPEWGEPISHEYYNFNNPIAFDLNEDGFPDIIDCWTYMLHSGEENEAEWNRPVYWGLNQVSDQTLVSDFDDDGSLDVIKPFYYGSYTDPGWRIGQYHISEDGWQDGLMFGDDCEDWWIDRAATTQLSTVDMYGDGTGCLVIGLYDFEQVRNGIFLYRDNDEDEGFDWQLVEGFFDSIIDPEIQSQVPSFGDLDDDGDPDMIIVKRIEYDDPWEIEFYRFSLDDIEPSWELEDGWKNGLENNQLTLAEFGDLDGDGDLDLVSRNALFENVGSPESPAWRHIPDAFEDITPVNFDDVCIVDTDGDGRLDIVTGSKCFLNNTPHQVKTHSPTPESFDLTTCPNPFNSTLKISFSLNFPGKISLKIYNANGQIIADRKGQNLVTGNHSVNFDTSPWPCGIYFVHFNDSRSSLTKKIAHLK